MRRTPSIHGAPEIAEAQARRRAADGAPLTLRRQGRLKNYLMFFASHSSRHSFALVSNS